MPEVLIILAVLPYLITSGFMTAHLGSEKGYHKEGFLPLVSFFPLLGCCSLSGYLTKPSVFQRKET